MINTLLLYIGCELDWYARDISPMHVDLLLPCRFHVVV